MNTLKMTLIAAAAVASASAASATNYFSIAPAVDAFDSVIELDVVRSSADGIVQIETLDGDVLGSADVFAGANMDVRLNGLKVGNDDVVAKLYHDGALVAERKIDVDRF